MTIVVVAVVEGNMGLTSGFAGTETSFVNFDLGLWEIVDSALAPYFAHMDHLASSLSFHSTLQNRNSGSPLLGREILVKRTRISCHTMVSPCC